MNYLPHAAAYAFTGLLAASLLSASCQSKSSAKAAAPAAAAAPQNLPVDVQVMHAVAYEATETAVGTLMPQRQVDVVSEVARKVVKVAFTDGAYVHRGQLLYKLDDADLRAKARKAQAALRLAQLDENRFAQLLKTQAARQQEYDQALATLQSLQAEVKVLEAEHAKTEIRAPFDGRIGITQVFEGAYVSPSLVLARLQDVSRLKVRFAVPEQYVRAMTPGTKVRFTTKLSSQLITAVVTATEPDVRADSRSLVVEAVAPNPDGRLRAGLSANVAFPTVGGSQQGISVPSEALVPSAGGYSVFVVAHGTAKTRAVTVQDRNEHRARISAGLHSGDTIMVSNLLRAMDGAPVQVVNVVSQTSAL